MSASSRIKGSLPESQQNLVKHRQAPLASFVRESSSLPPAQVSIADLWGTLVRRRRVILSFSVSVFILTAIYTFSRTALYEGVARLQIDPTRSSTLGLDDKPVPTDMDSRVKTEMAIIASDTVALQVMKSLNLYGNASFSEGLTTPGINDPARLDARQRQRLLERFDNNLLVKVVPNTQVVEIRFRNRDAALATATANSIIDEYMRRNFHTRVDGTSQVSQWLSRQMEDIRADTTVAQQKLADFQRQNNLLGSDESDNIVTDRLRQLNQELTQAEADRIVKEGRYRLANSGDPELIATVTPGTTAQVLRTQEAELRAEYAQLSSKFGHRYPKLRELRSQLGRLSSAIASETGNLQTRLSNEYSAAARAEAMIRSDFDKQKEEAYRLNEHVAQYAILKHQVESGQQLYDTLQLKLKEAGISSGLTSSYVSVVDRAQIPDEPVEPRRALYLALGLGGGLLGGVMLGLVLDSFDDTIQGSAGLEAVSALPELASVPYLAALATTRGKTLALGAPPNGGFGPLSFRQPNSPGAEAYRTLCSVILLSSNEIVDTPPVLPFADALALAARADGVILVARSGVSSGRLLLRVQDVLARSGANLLGLVLNAVRHPEYSYAYPAPYHQLGGQTANNNEPPASIDL